MVDRAVVLVMNGVNEPPRRAICTSSPSPADGAAVAQVIL